MNYYLLFLKLQGLFFILMKVCLLLKYFFFVKYRSEDWKALHLIYFPENNIIMSKDFAAVKAKKMQNTLSSFFVYMALAVMFRRAILKAYA